MSELTYSELVYELLSAGLIEEGQIEGINKYLLHRKVSSLQMYSQETKKQMIKDMVISFFGVTWLQILSPKRDRNICNARHVYFYACAMMLKESLKKIGRELSRDHTSVIHAREKIKGFIEIGEPETIEIVSRIKTKLNKLKLSV